MPAYSHFDYYLRSVVTAVLALGIIGVAAYDQIGGHSLSGPFKDWAALIIGVYFGSHISLNGTGARRRQASEETSTVAVPVKLTPTVATDPAPAPAPDTSA